MRTQGIGAAPAPGGEGGRSARHVGSLPDDATEPVRLTTLSVPLLVPEGAERGWGSTADAALDVLGAVEAATGAAHAARVVVLARVWTAALGSPETYLAPETAPDVAAKRLRGLARHEVEELVAHSVTAEVAVLLGVHHRTAATMLAEALVLTGGLPRVLAELRDGGLGWAHVRKIVDEVEPTWPAAVLAEFEDRVLERIRPAWTPGQVGRAAREVREHVHPEPADVRHERAVQERSVSIEPGA